MVRRFEDHSTRPNRALQAWIILVAKARNRQTVTYTMLDELMNFGNARALGPILDHIWKYCRLNQLPPLTILVVNKNTGMSSSGMGDFDFSQQEEVFSFDWYSIMPPTVEELEAANREELSG